MARPVKEGLDYFPMDVDFLHNIKVRKIMRSNGPQSPVVLLGLLSSIYGDHGYYMEWDDDVRFLMADDIGISEEAVDEVIKKAVKVNFFDKTIFEKFSVLTSRGIQKRYLQASKRKKDSGIQKRFCLLVNVSNNSVNVDNNPAQRELMHTETDKVKESKGNKNKEKDSRGDQTVTDPVQAVRDFYERNIGQLSPYVAQDIGYWLEDFSPDMLIEALKRTAEKNAGYNYTKGVLRGWQKDNVKTLADVKAANGAHDRAKQFKNGRKPVKETLPDWAQDGYEPPKPDKSENKDLPSFDEILKGD